MRLEEAFPRWQPLDCGAIRYSFVAWDQSITSALEPVAFQRLSEAMLEDVLRLQAFPPPGCNLVNLLYLQFEMTLSPIRLAINRGDFGLAHDWIGQRP